jgi:outer membrane protein assembly factor BamE (lipoprotein component of BamABCDE complex)
MKKIILGILFIALLGILIARQQLAYPPAWDEIQVGMSRQDVYERTGTPTHDTADIKGAFWFRDRLTQQQELWIYFDDDKVRDFSISERIGTADHFITRGVRQVMQ